MEGINKQTSLDNSAQAQGLPLKSSPNVGKLFLILLAIFIFSILTCIFGYFLGVGKSSTAKTPRVNIAPSPSMITPTLSAQKVENSKTTVQLNEDKLSYILPPGWGQLISNDSISISSPSIRFGDKQGQTYSSLNLEIKNFRKSLADYKKSIQNNVDTVITDRIIGEKQGFTYFYPSPGEVTSYVIDGGNSTIWDIHVSKPDGIPTDKAKGEQAEKELNDFINSITTD